MPLFFIYPGRLGGGLESTLGPYEIAKELGIDARLFLSKDNVRRQLVERLYPEAEFFNFTSVGDLLKMKKEIGNGWSFFTMISPKMIPLYFSLRQRKLFYFHATYDYSFSKRTVADPFMDFFHDSVIKSATLPLVTQAPMGWQIKIRLGRDFEVFPHPPYLFRSGFFAAEKKIDLPHDKYFLYFGDVDRHVKGIDVLVKTLETYPDLNAVIAGRGGRISKLKNIHHLSGWVDDGVMHHLIRNAQSVVLPYLVPAQFSGCMALSFHFRTPIIGSNLPTFQEGIEEGKTGWFFPSGDYKALGETMQDVLQGKKKYSKDAIAKKELEMKEKSKKRLKEILEQIGYKD